MKPLRHCAVALLLCILAVVADAQGSFFFDCQFGIDPLINQTRLNCWIPVYVTLQNAPESGMARISIRQKSAVVETYTELHPDSAKRVKLAIYCQEGMERKFTVSVVGKGLREKREYNIPPLPADAKVFAVASPRRGSHRVLLSRQDEQEQREDGVIRRRITYADADLLPTDPRSYQCIDVLIWEGQDWSRMPKERVQALTQWVQRGGHIVFAGGIGSSDHTALFGPTAPLFQSDLHLVNVEESSAMPGSNLAAAGIAGLGPGVLPFSRARVLQGRVLAKLDDKPVWVERELGFGRVSWLAFPLDLDPDAVSPAYRNWLETKLLHGAGARVANGLMRTAARIDIPRHFRKKNVLHLPGQWTIFWFGLLYLLLAIPYNRFVCGRIKKVAAAWVVVIVLALFFCGLALYSAGLSRGTTATVDSIRILVGKSNTGYTRSLAVSQFYYPTGRRKPLRDFPLGIAPTLEGWVFPNQYKEREVKGTLALQGAQWSQPDFRVRPWSTRMLFTESSTTLGGGIVSDLSWRGNSLKGTLINNTGCVIRSPRLITGNGTTALNDGKGTWDPGEEIAAGFTGIQSAVREDAIINEAKTYTLPLDTKRRATQNFDIVGANPYGYRSPNQISFSQSDFIPSSGCLLLARIEKAPAPLPEGMTKGLATSQWDMLWVWIPCRTKGYFDTFVGPTDFIYMDESGIVVPDLRDSITGVCSMDYMPSATTSFTMRFKLKPECNTREVKRAFVYLDPSGSYDFDQNKVKIYMIGQKKLSRLIKYSLLFVYGGQKSPLFDDQWGHVMFPDSGGTYGNRNYNGGNMHSIMWELQRAECKRLQNGEMLSFRLQFPENKNMQKAAIDFNLRVAAQAVMEAGENE
jgi:hypothetical protein